MFDEFLKCNHLNEAVEQYFPAVMFIMLYKMVLTFESVDEILNCDHSNESPRTVLSCDAVYPACEINRINDR